MILTASHRRGGDEAAPTRRSKDTTARRNPHRWPADRRARVIMALREHWEYAYDLLADIVWAWTTQHLPHPAALDELTQWLDAQQPPQPPRTMRHRTARTTPDEPEHPYDTGYRVGYRDAPETCGLSGEEADYWHAGHAAGQADRRREVVERLREVTEQTRPRLRRD